MILRGLTSIVNYKAFLWNLGLVDDYRNNDHCLVGIRTAPTCDDGKEVRRGEGRSRYGRSVRDLVL